MREFVTRVLRKICGASKSVVAETVLDELYYSFPVSQLS